MSLTVVEPTRSCATETVAVVMVVRGEPVARVERALDALSVQRGVEPFSVVIASPCDDVEALRAIRPRGAVRALVFVENPSGERSAGLNVAVRAACAEIVVRVDARSVVRADHVTSCVARLHADPTIGMVGGVQRPEAFSGSVRARGIARALRNPWLLGNAAYRRPGASGATDTVYLGAFRVRELLGLGGYDERLEANEDYDLSTRYRAAGRIVWLEEGLVVGYEPRNTLRGLARQYRAFGASKVEFWRETRRRPNTRQRVALAGGVAGALAVVGSLRRPRCLLALGALAGVGIAALDHFADPSETDPHVRVEACSASALIVASWLAGVASEFVAAGPLRRVLRRTTANEHGERAG